MCEGGGVCVRVVGMCEGGGACVRVVNVRVVVHVRGWAGRYICKCRSGKGGKRESTT